LSTGNLGRAVLLAGAFLLALLGVASLYLLALRWLSGRGGDAGGRASDRLREPFYRDLVETIDAIVLRVDRAGRITFVNRYAQEFFGYRRDEILGRHVVGTIVPEVDRSGQDLRVLMTAIFGEPSRFARNENENMRRSGERVWVRWHNKLLTDARGEISEVLCIGHDATPQREADARLRLLAAAVEQAADMILLADAFGAVTYVNPAFERATGWPLEEARGRRPQDLLRSGAHDRSFHREIQDRLRRGQPWRGRLVNRARDGALFETEGNINPLRADDGRLVGWVCVERNVQREVELEERLRRAERLEAIGALAGGIAHDFNNVLVAILGHAELLREDVPADSVQRESIDQILAGGRRAAELARQVLGFSREISVGPVPVDVATVVEEALKLLRPTLPATIAIDCDFETGAGEVLAVPSKLHQVVVNLCTNAAQAMDLGGLLGLSLRRVSGAELAALQLPEIDAAQDHVLLEVHDTGVGIPPGLLERIFDPLFTTKETTGGTGLGLATVRSIVRESGGTIVVESAPHRGSTFSIYLPRLRSSPAQAPVEAASGGLARGAGEHVLLVDDDAAVRRLTAALLDRLGYRVSTAASGAEAFDLVERADDRFDLVLTDLTMPQMTGRDLMRLLARRHPNLPVVLMTGAPGGEGDEDRPGERRLAKPFTGRQLARTVRDALEQQAAS
jgi:PAS domain S-box-containing protein